MFWLSEANLNVKTPCDSFEADAVDHQRLVRTWLAQGENYAMSKLAGSKAGWSIIHIVARFVDGTPVGSNGDWKHLAGMLGLHVLDIVVQIFLLVY